MNLRRECQPFPAGHYLGLSTAASATMTLGGVSEPLLARAAHARNTVSDGAVLINANENPLGLSEGARAAAMAIVPQGGRYQWDLTDKLVETFAQMERLKTDYVRLPGKIVSDSRT